MSKHLNHITLSTGHTRRSPRAEVGDDTIKALRPWLKAALIADRPAPLPGPLGQRDGFAASCWIDKGALRCTIVDDEGLELLTFGIAARSRQSGELWASLAAQYGTPEPMAAPGTPWCAVALLPGYAKQHGVSAWAGDFERCLAWTWLDNPSGFVEF